MQTADSSNIINPKPAGAIGYLASALIWLAGACFVSGTFATGVPWHSLVAILFLSVPLVGFILYQQVIARTLHRLQFHPGSLFYRLFSGRLSSLVLAMVLGIPAAVFLLIRLHGFSWLQWGLLLAAIPVFLAVYRRARTFISTQYRPWLVTLVALRWARLLTPVVLALVYVLIELVSTPQSATAITLTEAISNARMQVADLQGSMALKLAAESLMIIDGMQTFAIHYPGSADGRWMLLAAVIDAWLVFWLATTVFSAFMLSWTEWRRVLVPLTDAPVPPALTAYDFGLNSAVVSFILVFVLLPLSAWLETEARHRQPLQAVPETFVLHLEQIGDDWYRPGTSQQLEQAKQAVLVESGVAMAGLQEAIDHAFDAVAGNVDLYLDWYYSLGGEYTRIAHLLAGNLEQYIANKLLQTLQQGDVFAGVQQQLQAALLSNQVAAAQYRQQAQRILDQNRFARGDWQIEPLLQVELASVLEAPVHQDLISLQSRLLAASSGSAVAGVMTGAVAAKLGSRMIAKGSFKLAAKALGKLVASKTAGASLGAGAGAAAGAAAGSIVPGVGTAIGAIIGGIAGGLAVGIGIDKALIEFEEAVSREAFRQELLATLNEVQAEFALP
jgi:hypothetical protein